MGLQIGELVSRKEVSFSDLSGKKIAVDAFNALYQFLSSVRQPDGTPLMDSKGNVTSHLSGLFYRNISLLSEGLKLIYVFDGHYHILKGKTHEKRDSVKQEAKERYDEAVEAGDLDSMGRYARQMSVLNKNMIDESKELLEAMGIAVYQAAGEGEVQCAEIVKRGEAYAVASQDYDALVVGGKRLVQNLTLARKRKTPNGYISINPEMIDYERMLQSLEIDRDQFICLAVLVGTDFNPGGVRGIGPKKALALVQRKKYPVEIFRDLEEQGKLDFDWKEIFEIFKNPRVSKDAVKTPKIDEAKIKEILVERHDFSEDRVEKQLQKLRDSKGKQTQQKLF